MLDMTDTIEPKSDQLNADDLITGPRTVTITKMSKQKGDQPVAISFEGDNGKPYLPAKSMRRVMVFAWGKNGQDYVGKSMTLFRDPEVTWGGAKVGGIRISHMSDIKKKLTVSLTATSNSKRPFTVQPLTVEEKPKVDLGVVKAGDEAAGKGVDAYKEWLGGLNPDVKETVKSHHKKWSATATAADTPDDDAPVM